jgi:hypothetical protein
MGPRHGRLASSYRQFPPFHLACQILAVLVQLPLRVPRFRLYQLPRPALVIVSSRRQRAGLPSRGFVIPCRVLFLGVRGRASEASRLGSWLGVVLEGYGFLDGRLGAWACAAR